MECAVLSKNKLDKFVKYLSRDQKVMGPVSIGNNNYKFQEVHSVQEMSLKHIPTILPPKKYFMPQYETLLEYDVSNGQEMTAVVELEEMVLFGVHTCDLAGIQCLSIVFSDRPKDLHYLVRKNHIILIGFECTEYCDSYASCAMMKNHLPKGGYDLFFTELENHYYIHINTYHGEKLITGSKLFDEISYDIQNELNLVRERKAEVFKNEVPIRYQDIPRLFEETFESPVWDKLGEKCLSCGNCTNVCPTCYCFDVQDIPDLDLSTGKRIRVWDSCQHEDFAKVAGGESFREKRGDRKRHRFNRKFKYPMDRYGRLFCTGCGRCSRACMAEIDLKKTIFSLIEERG